MLLIPSFIVLFTMPRKYIDVQRLAERLKNEENKIIEKNNKRKKAISKEVDNQNLPILNDAGDSNRKNN